MEALPFVVAGGSVPGTDHTKPGQPGWINNQDAFAWMKTDNVLVAVVCDGCGSMPHSDVGAQLMAPLIAKHLAVVSEDLQPKDAFTMLERWVYPFMEHTARAIGVDVQKTINEYFLFTVLGVLITPKHTVIFEAGDGVYAVNGETTVIPPYPDNAPPYLGHRFTGGWPRNQIGIRIREQRKTEEITSILLGTDGVTDVIRARDKPFPGRKEGPVFGPLSQFWEDELFVANSDMIRRGLARANREAVEDGLIKKGLLSDDTTIVVVRRQSEGGGNA
ncbi:MAG: hypothetical protein ABA06_03770 [Parcubacteria bacterium C7867-001]|nr:MAG: hypothetical protein ABA06_03770 [Parcubacteria bacterium C7867-001]